ncbi:zinc ABC transporter substrate-binding protein [bacterium]|nr:zinc ABC transporter substrate-binding protein [bacterium]
MRRLLFIMIIVFLGVFCRKREADSDRMTVVTSIFPVFDMVRQVTPEGTDVQVVVPVGADPHAYEMLPAQIQAISRADVFIGIQPEFDGWIGRFLPPGAAVFYLNSQPEGDPHIWMSVRQAKKMVDRIAVSLSSVEPGDSAACHSRALSYQERLDSLDTAIARRFATVRQRSFIQWHPAWDRFAADYHLTVFGTVEQGHGDEISMRAFSRLIADARRQQIRAVIAGARDQNNAIPAFVNEIGGVCLYLDILGDPADPDRNSYIRYMAMNAQQLADFLEAL